MGIVSHTKQAQSGNRINIYISRSYTKKIEVLFIIDGKIQLFTYFHWQNALNDISYADRHHYISNVFLYVTV